MGKSMTVHNCSGSSIYHGKLSALLQKAKNLPSMDESGASQNVNLV
jgi:hypothetical protein